MSQAKKAKSVQRDEETTPEATDATVPDYSGSPEEFKVRGLVHQKESMPRGQYSSTFLNNILFEGKTDQGMEYQKRGSLIVQWPTENFTARVVLDEMFTKFRNEAGEAVPVEMVLEKQVVERGEKVYTNFNVKSVEFETTDAVNAIDVTRIGMSNIR